MILDDRLWVIEEILVFGSVAVLIILNLLLGQIVLGWLSYGFMFGSGLALGIARRIIKSRSQLNSKDETQGA